MLSTVSSCLTDQLFLTGDDLASVGLFPAASQLECTSAASLLIMSLVLRKFKLVNNMLMRCVRGMEHVSLQQDVFPFLP